ncbi:hypothetical protein [Gorillibacterium sp. sgz5001074]|uniref:hypothetical protein n=1 Tax=Gorillibacterium sp. sgz5001074 TaxID=3446695 RepID=UPI003F661092
MSERLQTLQSRLELYIACESAILDGAQEYSIGSRRLSRADLGEIAKMIGYLEKEITTEKAKAGGGGRNKVLGIVPRDI